MEAIRKGAKLKKVVEKHNVQTNNTTAAATNFAPNEKKNESDKNEIQNMSRGGKNAQMSMMEELANQLSRRRSTVLSQKTTPTEK